jgi:hypothetical protein
MTYGQRYVARLKYTWLACVLIFGVLGFAGGGGMTDIGVSRAQVAFLSVLFATLFIAPLVNLAVAAFPSKPGTVAPVRREPPPRL